ncbi:hypothetical protein [Haloarchaeobius sp. DT45]|uniref:hypothetical protein n=1 Tax=Haloarchaeobius sp. DT45 TaxID=3446116 RepID=UPI003F6C69A5
MNYECARCGSTEALPEKLPIDWSDYLREERGLSVAIHGWRVPLCGEHYADFEHLRETWMDRGYLDDEEVERIESDAENLLDSLDLDQLVDEM